MNGRIRIAVAISIVVTAACGRSTGPGDDGAGGRITHPTRPDELVLRVDTSGGFVAPLSQLPRIPTLSMFGDGRLITEGPQIEIYPAPALPNVLVRTVSEEGMQAILEEAESAGLLGSDAHYPFPCIADAATTTFTVVADGRRHEVSAYALGEGQGTCAGSDERARSRLAAFQRRLSDLGSWLPDGSLGPERTFDPEAMRVYVEPYSQAPDPRLEQRPVDWPLATPLSRFGGAVQVVEGLSCGVVSDSDLSTLMPLARTANELTPWRSAGGDYRLAFRPLLPDETGC